MKKLAPFLFAFVTIIGVAIAPTLTHAVDSQMCYDLYQPVCAAQPVECFAAPCYPVYKTYSNSCFMQSDNAILIHEGECSATETGPFKSGAPVVTTPPPVATSSPVTPPTQPVVPPPVAPILHHGSGPVVITHPVVTAATSVAATTTATTTPAHAPSFFSRLWHTIIGWFGFH